MKTASEEILGKYKQSIFNKAGVPSGAYTVFYEKALLAMDEYASLRESKWRELYEAQKELQKLTDKIFGLTCEEIERKYDLNQKVAKLEQELGLIK